MSEDTGTTATVASTNGLSGMSVLGSADCFASPDVVRLQLGEVNPKFASLWVEVKSEITVYERDRITASQLTAIAVGNEKDGYQDQREVRIDTARGNYWKLKTWLVDWNLPGRGGKTAPLGESTLRNLKPEVADTIMEAIDRHIAGWQSGKAESAE